jgi:hypothetical protein
LHQSKPPLCKLKIATFQLKNAKNLTARYRFVKEKRFFSHKKGHFLTFYRRDTKLLNPNK